MAMFFKIIVGKGFLWVGVINLILGFCRNIERRVGRYVSFKIRNFSKMWGSYR